MRNDSELFYRVSTVAESLGMDQRTIRRGIERGEIPSVRIGNAIRVPVAWVRQVAGLPEEVPA